MFSIKCYILLCILTLFVFLANIKLLKDWQQICRLQVRCTLINDGFGRWVDNMKNWKPFIEGNYTFLLLFFLIHWYFCNQKSTNILRDQDSKFTVVTSVASMKLKSDWSRGSPVSESLVVPSPVAQEVKA